MAKVARNANEVSLRLEEADRFERLRLIPWWDQELLLRSTVLVVGAGALGNEAIKNLALSGVGRLIIVDSDVIDPTNLPRSILFREADCGRMKAEVASKAAQEISPAIQTKTIVGNVLHDVGLGVFRSADIVLGCLDNREARLWVNRSCWRVGRPWIDAGIQEVQGSIQCFGSRCSPCYECGMKDLDYRLIHARYRCPGIPREEAQVGLVPTTPTISSLLAAWQTQLAIKAIHGMTVPWGQAIVFNGIVDQTYKTNLAARSDCLSHEPWEVDLEVTANVREETARRLLLRCKEEWTGDWTLMLERRMMTRLVCSQCGYELLFQVPRGKITSSESKCAQCQAWMDADWLEFVNADSPLASLSLDMLGIPDEDWVRVRYEESIKTVSINSTGED